MMMMIIIIMMIIMMIIIRRRRRRRRRRRPFERILFANLFLKKKKDEDVCVHVKLAWRAPGQHGDEGDCLR